MTSISSAPKDGTVILGARWDGGWKWFAPIKWFTISQWHPANWGHAEHHHAEPPFWGATHWMAMPEVDDA